MDYFTLFYTTLGGLGIFFLGMRFLSESLQSLAGDLIKRLISAVTSHRVLAVGVGLLVTTLVQSSSVTTVMVVGLVNAGLMSLLQAIGVILGSNIGTTITGWILVVKIGKYGLLLIGLGIFPMLFAKRTRTKGIGKVFVALGLVFVGLETMSGAFKPLRSDAGFLELMTILDAQSVLSILGCVVVGCLLTFLIQSSSAMLGITIALGVTGAITYPSAAALVLGENIGTTITALLAGIGASRNAKRAALSHAIFNLLGVGCMVALFPLYIGFVDYLVPGSPDMLAADGSKPFIAAHIAAGHTLFNVTAVLLFIPFIGYLARLVCAILPPVDEEERFGLRYISGAGAATPTVAIRMAALELVEMSKKTRKMLSHSRKYLRSDTDLVKSYDRVKTYEPELDNIQKEITAFLCRAVEDCMTSEESEEAYAIIRAADELESVADQAEAIVIYRKRLFDMNQNFSDAGWAQGRDFFDSVSRFFVGVIEEQFAAVEGQGVDAIRAKGGELSAEAERLKTMHLERISRGECNPEAAMIFSDVMVALRRIKNHTVNLAEALAGKSATDSFDRQAAVGGS